MRERLQRRLVRVLIGTLPTERAEVLGVMSNAIAAVNEERKLPGTKPAGVTELPSVTEISVTEIDSVTESAELFFTDAARQLPSGYASKPLTRRDELEKERQRLRTMLWSCPEDKVEIEREVEAIEAELRGLSGGER